MSGDEAKSSGVKNSSDEAGDGGGTRGPCGKLCPKVDWKTGWGLDHPTPQDFYRSQWAVDRSKPSRAYVLIRLALFLYYTFFWFYYGSQKWRYFFIYFTTLSWTLICIDALIQFYLAFTAYRRKSCDISEGMTKFLKFSWVVSNAIYGAAMGFTPVYWLMLYPDHRKAESFDLYENVVMHLENAVYVVFAIMLESKPLKPKHFYCTLGFAYTFFAFSLIYFWAGGTNEEGKTYIYPFLQWDKPGMTLAYIPFFSLIVLCGHFLAYGIYKLRMRIYEWKSERAPLVQPGASSA